MIDVKYGCEWGGWCSSLFSGPYGVSLWKKILEGGGPLYLGLFCMKFEMDQKCGFGQIDGVEHLFLQTCYPEICRNCRNKEASVADLMRYTNGVLHWEIHFCRDVHNRKLEAFWSFIIYSTSVKGIGEDKSCWLPCKNKGFMVSAYYHLIVGHSEQFFP